MTCFSDFAVQHFCYNLTYTTILVIVLSSAALTSA